MTSDSEIIEASATRRVSQHGGSLAITITDLAKIIGAERGDYVTITIKKP